MPDNADREALKLSDLPIGSRFKARRAGGKALLTFEVRGVAGVGGHLRYVARVKVGRDVGEFYGNDEKVGDRAFYGVQMIDGTD